MWKVKRFRDCFWTFMRLGVLKLKPDEVAVKLQGTVSSNYQEALTDVGKRPVIADSML